MVGGGGHGPFRGLDAPSARDGIITQGLTLTLRHPLCSRVERRWTTLNRRFYRTGQFARRASVTLRTLRYYDRVGLLCPAQHTESGYRLYTDEDLVRLQQILGLKFLGFSLQEVQACLEAGPQRLAEVLAQQKAMMAEKRRQLDAILRAIEETEQLLDAGRCDWDAIAGVIRIIQMEQKPEWVRKYFTEEQLRKLEELGQGAYSPGARETLAARGGGWTEADQQRAQEQWAYVAAEARRLAAAGADPGGPEAQAVAKLKCDLLSAFTQGDPEVEAGLKRFWEHFRALPEEERPFDASAYEAGDEGSALLDQAMAIYRQRAAG
jgi:DNA-binding transcriptional MerR regulator